jgi:hypothetical protein
MSTPGALDPKAVERTLAPAESTLLRLLLLHPELVSTAEARLRSEDLVTTPARELWSALRAAQPTHRPTFLAGLDPTLEAIARTLYARTDPVPDDAHALGQVLDQSLLTLERNRLDEEVEFKKMELTDAEARGDRETVRRLLDEVRGLQVRRDDLDTRKDHSSLLSKRRIPPTTTTPTPAGGPA